MNSVGAELRRTVAIVWVGGVDATSRATPLLSASSQQGTMNAIELLSEYSFIFFAKFLLLTPQ